MFDQKSADLRAEIKQIQAETWLQLQENARLLKRLGEKIGGFTEGMAFPSMEKTLGERFGMNVFSVRNIARKDGRSLDVLAYSNAWINEVYVVEVKSHLCEDGLQQMLRILREFHDFYDDTFEITVPDSFQPRAY